MAEELIVLGVALLGTKVLHFVPVEVGHHGLCGGQAASTGAAVFSPQLLQLRPEEETAPWEERGRQER